MNEKDEIKLTHSGLISINQEPCVSVRFERGQDFAEAVVPSCKILKHQGFSQDEKEGLEKYLEENAKDIMVRARDITGIKQWF